MCIGENEEESPWQPLSVDGGVAAGTDAVSATLLRTSEFVDNRHTSDPEKLLNDFADTLSRTGALVFRHADAGIVFCPEHAQLLARAGMSKDDVRGWLVERCGRTRGDLDRVGKSGVTENGVRFDLGDRDLDGFDPIFAADSPQHLMIAVAGARNAGMSMVVRLFANWSQIAARVDAPRRVPQRIPRRVEETDG